MLKFLFLLCFCFFTTYNSIQAQALNEYISSLSSFEIVSDFYFDIMPSFTDSRWVRDYSLSKDQLIVTINNELKNKHFNLIEESSKYGGLLPIKLNIKISYLNFYESSGGNVFGKGILDLEIVDPNKSIHIKNYTVSSSIPFLDLDIDDYGDPNYSSSFEKMGQKVINELVERLISKLDEFTKEAKLGYRNIRSIGYAPIVDTVNIADAKKAATLDALQKACSKVYGFKIENLTKMLDYEVSDQITTELKGYILDYYLFEEYSLITSDNYYCVLIEAILPNR